MIEKRNIVKRSDWEDARKADKSIKKASEDLKSADRKEQDGDYANTRT